MKLETSRFGTIEISDDKIIHFTQPILGFANHRRFVLLEDAPDSLIQWLQSSDDPDLAFLVIDPLTVVPDYEVVFHSDDLADLEIKAEGDAVLLTLVVVSEHEIRTNLKAPIIFNPAAHKAKQVVLHDSDYPVRFYIVQPEGEAATTDAGSHA